MKKNDDEHYFVDNSLLYFHSRNTLEDGHLNYQCRDGERWPSCRIETDRKTLKAIATLRPGEKIEGRLSIEEMSQLQAKMIQFVEQISDATADVFDAVVIKFIQQAKYPTEMISISADEILSFRGIKPRSYGGDVRGSGYKARFRQEIAKHVEILSNLWITVAEYERIQLVEGKGGRKYPKKSRWQGRSRALVVSSQFGKVRDDDSLAATKWLVRPGDVFAPFLFGPVAAFALMSRKALQFDPIKQYWEKRLARYFSYVWRVRQSRGHYTLPFRLETLLVNGVKIDIETRYPRRLFDRIEATLDVLHRDQVISGWHWHPDDYCEHTLSKHQGWWHDVLQWRIVIEPPQCVMGEYQKMPVADDPKVVGEEANCDFHTKLRVTRTNRGLTQMQLAELLGITPLYISYIERGVRKPSSKLKRKLTRWIEQNVAGPTQFD